MPTCDNCGKDITKLHESLVLYGLYCSTACVEEAELHVEEATDPELFNHVKEDTHDRHNY